MIRIVVVGAAGRMGKQLVAEIAAAPDMVLAGAVEAPGHPAQGRDAGEVAGVESLGVPIGDAVSAAAATAHALIDFSFHEAAPGNAAAAVRAGCAAVIGSTGLSEDERAAVAAVAAREQGRVVLAPNMSVGVNLLFHLCGRVAAALGDDYDIEVVEMHHNRKKDAPSGTAVRLGELLAEATGMDYDSAACHGRHGLVGARPRRQIGMHAVRGGDVVGEHTIIFAADGERVELSHKASSRATFVAGALRAVRFLMSAAPGLYDMQDVLGLN